MDENEDLLAVAQQVEDPTLSRLQPESVFKLTRRTICAHVKSYNRDDIK